ncbi:MAG: enoyl-CoA hydratase/isomerase family protein [Gemmatimonadota bacterium]|nr:enoyl-CoA hydratase/isomerase family protein [Gemmatimonadota bacterium]
MTSPPLDTALDGGVLTLTLDRPDKRNALSTALVEALLASLDRADLDAAVRVVVIRGAGKDFCAGADLAELLDSADRALDENEREARRLGLVFERIRALPKPVIAAVHGRALAGGAGLATACDLVVCGASAQLGYPEIQRGFVPAMVMTLLRRLAGERVAFDLVATGRVLAADEALRLGLVSRVVPDERVDGEALELAARMESSSATALALTKRLLYDLDGLSFDEGIALGARVNAAARATPDFRTAISAFLRQ